MALFRAAVSSNFCTGTLKEDTETQTCTHGYTQAHTHTQTLSFSLTYAQKYAQKIRRKYTQTQPYSHILAHAQTHTQTQSHAGANAHTYTLTDARTHAQIHTHQMYPTILSIMIASVGGLGGNLDGAGVTWSALIKDLGNRSRLRSALRNIGKTSYQESPTGSCSEFVLKFLICLVLFLIWFEFVP